MKPDVKRDLIRNLINEKPTYNKDTEDTYVKRLEEGQGLMTSLIEQADFAIKLLESEIDENKVPEQHLIIANFNRLNKIPYYQDKNDVISISSASVIIQSMIEQHINASKIFHNLNGQEIDTITNLKAFKLEYEQLNEHIDEIIKFKNVRIDELRQELSTNSLVISNDAKIHELNSTMEETDQDLKNLNKCLKRMVFKYLYFDNASLTTDEINDKIQTIVEFLNKLIKNVITNNGYLSIEPNALERSLINNMIMNDIIVIDSSKGEMLVQLRDYSK